MVSLLIHLGDRLGLYRAMWGAGPVSSQELADRTGLHERWVREWLRGQGAAGLLVWHDDDRFELSDAAAAVLADEDNSLFFAAGAFGSPPAPDFVDDLAGRLRVRHRPSLRPPGTGRCAPHRAHARPVVAPGAGSDDPPGPRRGGRQARGRRHLRRRRLRCRRGAGGHGRAVPPQSVPRLRHLPPRHRAGRRAGGRGRARQRRAPPGRSRRAPGRGDVRPRAHLRLPARHDRADRDHRGDPPGHRGRRDLAREGHPLGRHGPGAT